MILFWLGAPTSVARAQDVTQSARSGSVFTTGTWAGGREYSGRMETQFGTPRVGLTDAGLNQAFDYSAFAVIPTEGDSSAPPECTLTPSEETSYTTWGFYQVAPGNDFLTEGGTWRDVSVPEYTFTTSYSGTCQSYTMTMDMSVQVPANQLPAGCYQSSFWNASIWFPGATPGGSVGTLNVGLAEGACGTVAKCDNGVDDDGDGRTDYLTDPGCSNRNDDSELGPPEPQCDNGDDDDDDGRVDYNADGSGDPGCTGPEDNDESQNLDKCVDGIDNDGDGTTDVGFDPGCVSREDQDELGNTKCDNGEDDDRDGGIDVRGDPDCHNPSQDDETTCLPGFTRRTFRARVDSFFDVDLFRFHPQVRYCYTADRAEILSADATGDIDWGWDDTALGLLGFSVRYDIGELDIQKNPSAAVFNADFDVRFDAAALLLRVPVVRIVRRYFQAKLSKRVAKALRENDYDEFEREVLVRGLAEQRHKINTAFDKQLERLYTLLPDALARRISGHVLDQVDGFLTGLERILKAELSRKDFGVLTVAMVGDRFVSAAIRVVNGWTTGATCAQSRFCPNDFSVWTPMLTVAVEPGGRVTWSDPYQGFVSPFLTIDVIDGFTSTPAREVAGTAAREVAEQVDMARLAGTGSTAVRLAAEPGTVTVDLLAEAARSPRAAARRSRVLARGTRRFATRGWDVVRLRATRVGRRVLRRARRLRAVVRVTVAPVGGTRTQSSVRATLVRARKPAGRAP